jgi:hypothetical protein
MLLSLGMCVSGVATVWRRLLYQAVLHTLEMGVSWAAAICRVLFYQTEFKALGIVVSMAASACKVLILVWEHELVEIMPSVTVHSRNNESRQRRWCLLTPLRLITNFSSSIAKDL